MILILPILIPLVTAAFCLLAWRYKVLQRLLGVLGAFGLLAAGVFLLREVSARRVLALQVGAWPAPFGITLVADLLSALMIVVTGLMGAAVAVYSTANIDLRRESFGYYPLFHVLLMGVSGSFLTGDMFNLYVWFEVMLIASFVLIALGGERVQIEGALKYVTLNLVASAVFLAGAGLLYSVAGTLNMADLAMKLRGQSGLDLMNVLAMLLLVAFGTKAAVFPLFFWLPASYHTPPVAVSAIFAGLLTKVGVYALIRVFTLIFVQDPAFTHGLILMVAGLTMITGVLGAVAQNEFRRILSYHIISQIGYLLMGLGLFTPMAVAASVFYIVHHIIVKTNLFLISGITEKLGGSHALKQMGGIYDTRPVIGVLFLVPALSLAGLPPLSGFFAKYLLVKAGLGTGDYVIEAVALLVSLLTLFSMTKIWAEVFWKPAPKAKQAQSTPHLHSRAGMAALTLPAATLALVTVGIGLAPGYLFRICERTSEQLLNPASYIEAVMGANR